MTDLKAAIGMIRANHNGLKTDFEGCIRLLLPVDPFKPRGGRSFNGKRNYADVGSVNVDNIAESHGTGKTGVEFCHYTTSQYRQLSQEQKDELRLWRLTPEGKKALANSKPTKNKSSSKTYLSKQDVKKMRQCAAAMLTLSKEKDNTEPELDSENANPVQDNKVSMKATALKLQGILKRVKHS